MALITLTMNDEPYVQFAPTRNPEYNGLTRKTAKHQPKDFTDGAELYSYNHGDAARRTLHWTNLPTADMQYALYLMFYAKGGKTLTFVDEDGTTFSATRIDNAGDLPYRYVGGGRWELTLELLVA